MSVLPKTEIAELMKSDDPREIEAALARLGASVDKVFLIDRFQQLLKKGGG